MTTLIKSATIRLVAWMESSWSLAIFPTSWGVQSPIQRWTSKQHSSYKYCLRSKSIMFNLSFSFICKWEAKMSVKKEFMSVGLGTFLNDVYLSEYEITLIKSIFTYFPVIYGLGWIKLIQYWSVISFLLLFLFSCSTVLFSPKDGTWLSENPG